MRFCPFCSAENPSEASECASCGRRLPPLPARKKPSATSPVEGAAGGNDEFAVVPPASEVRRPALSSLVPPPSAASSPERPGTVDPAHRRRVEAARRRDEPAARPRSRRWAHRRWSRGIRFDTNRGLGSALDNAGLDASRGALIAYLPSDDVWYQDHLASMTDLFANQPDLVLAYSGVRHHYNRSTPGQIEDEPLQLVQTMHRRTGDRWLERTALTTDDLERMLWSRLRARGHVAGTGHITCEWVDHPGQRHKLLREPIGGINPYRLYCNVREPMRFHSTEGNFIDEVERYARFRDRPDTPLAADGLKILLVGELAYNPERVLALEERGHQLYGLWMPNPYWYNYVGPLPSAMSKTSIPRHGKTTSAAFSRM